MGGQVLVMVVENQNSDFKDACSLNVDKLYSVLTFLIGCYMPNLFCESAIQAFEYMDSTNLYNLWLQHDMKKIVLIF